MRLSTTEIRFLTLSEKVQYIRHNGVFCGTRTRSHYQIQVYRLSAYFAELWIHPSSRMVEKVVINE